MIKYEGTINGSQVSIQCDDIFEFANVYDYVEKKSKQIDVTLDYLFKVAGGKYGNY